MTQAHDPDPRPWTIHRNRRGSPRWYQRWLEAFWIITGRWSLHAAWQEGVFHGSRMEYQRVVGNWGDLSPILFQVIEATYDKVSEHTGNARIQPSHQDKGAILRATREKMVAIGYGQHRYAYAVVGCGQHAYTFQSPHLGQDVPAVRTLGANKTINAPGAPGFVPLSVAPTVDGGGCDGGGGAVCS